MFEFDAAKLVIIAIAALIFIGPKDLPRVMRQVGQVVGKLRRMGAEFQSQLMDAMNEAGAEDIKTGVGQLAESAKIDLGFDPVAATNEELRKTVGRIEAPENAAAPKPAHEAAAETASERPPVMTARAVND